eukprot:Clim_evm32s201 gene=Clim_evmTU32s201
MSWFQTFHTEERVYSGDSHGSFFAFMTTTGSFDHDSDDHHYRDDQFEGHHHPPSSLLVDILVHILATGHYVHMSAALVARAVQTVLWTEIQQTGSAWHDQGVSVELHRSLSVLCFYLTYALVVYVVYRTIMSIFSGLKLVGQLLLLPLYVINWIGKPLIVAAVVLCIFMPAIEMALYTFYPHLRDPRDNAYYALDFERAVASAPGGYP